MKRLIWESSSRIQALLKYHLQCILNVCVCVCVDEYKTPEKMTITKKLLSSTDDYLEGVLVGFDS